MFLPSLLAKNEEQTKKLQGKKHFLSIKYLLYHLIDVILYRI